MSNVIPPRMARFLRRKHIANSAQGVTLYVNGEEIDYIRVDPGNVGEQVSTLLIGIGEEFPGCPAQLRVSTQDGTDPLYHDFDIPHRAPGQPPNMAAEMTRMARVYNNGMESLLSRLERQNTLMQKTYLDTVEQLQRYAKANAKIEMEREERAEESRRQQRRDDRIDHLLEVGLERLDEVVLGGLGSHSKDLDQKGEQTALTRMRDRGVRFKLKKILGSKTPEQRMQILGIFRIEGEHAIDRMTIEDLTRKLQALDVDDRDKLLAMLTQSEQSMLATLDESLLHRVVAGGK